jgi:cytochrome c biogenesis protein CcmG/thiol:disulfide interchange protein DsbE
MKSRTRTGLIVAGIIIVGGGLYTASHLLRHELFTIEPGSEAPIFTAVSLESPPRKRSLSDYKGQVVLLNVWATWCEPCRVEMPSIEALHNSLGAKGLKIVAVSVDEPGFESQVRDFVKQYRLTFDVLYDPAGKIRELYQTTGYPETFVIGKDGLIRRKLIGATDWNTPGNRALIEHLLAERSD